MTRAFAVAVFASNWLSWRGIPALANATGFAVSTAILCAVTVTLIIVALVAHSRPRWLWIVALAATVAQMVEVLIPLPGAGSQWEYAGPIFAMACAAFVYLAAIGAFLVSLDRASRPVVDETSSSAL